MQALKAEHANIVKILTRVSDLGVDSDDGRKTLMAARTGLLAHLSREDEHLYPVLKKGAEQDAILGDALGVFMEDMEGVSQAALAFFEKYETGDEHNEFAADFGQLVNVLSQRIQKEESVIYKMYDQLEDWRE